MPVYGLVHDSPLIYGARRLSRGIRGRRGGGGGGRYVERLKTTVTFSYSFKELKIYDSILRAELNTPVGDLWRYLERRADRAVRGAKRQVGKKTGRLMKSIHKRHLGNYTGQYIWIGSNTVPYAYAHHEGTRPHIITPKEGGADGRLVFRKGSRIIVTPLVNHPGTRGNPYLRDQLVHFRF
jgi:hypothetical protein